MRFEFATATRIIFGEGTLPELGPLTASKSVLARALVVTGADAGRAAPLLEILVAHKVIAVTFAVTDEPTVPVVQQGAQVARDSGCDLVIAMGGGSVMDAGKAIAALLTNPGDPFDYLEVIGKELPLQNAPAPCFAIPTTAGTGTEVTRNAVLASPEHRVKVSLRSPLMLPDVALIDPTLTYSMPPAITAQTGLDALTQVIEPFVSRLANPLTDAVCREGIRRAAGALRRAYDDGADTGARHEMALASLCGGLALANAKLGAVHGFAGPFGGTFYAPHGAVCAALLPHVMALNVDALHQREPQHPSLARYTEIARSITGDANASAYDGADWVGELVDDLDIPGLGSYGFGPDDFDVLIEKAARSSSMKGNPIQLEINELQEILKRAL